MIQKKTVVMEHIGICPCGKNIFASRDEPCIAHDAPLCEAFDKMDPDEFVTYVRRSRGLPDPNRPEGEL